MEDRSYHVHLCSQIERVVGGGVVCCHGICKTAVLSVHGSEAAAQLFAAMASARQQFFQSMGQKQRQAAGQQQSEQSGGASSSRRAIFSQINQAKVRSRADLFSQVAEARREARGSSEQPVAEDPWTDHPASVGKPLTLALLQDMDAKHTLAGSTSKPDSNVAGRSRPLYHNQGRRTRAFIRKVMANRIAPRHVSTLLQRFADLCNQNRCKCARRVCFSQLDVEVTKPLLEAFWRKKKVVQDRVLQEMCGRGQEGSLRQVPGLFKVLDKVCSATCLSHMLSVSMKSSCLSCSETMAGNYSAFLCSVWVCTPISIEEQVLV